MRHRISTVTHELKIDESQLALGCAGASRSLPRTESRHGLVVCPGSWSPGQTQVGGYWSVAPHRFGTRGGDCDCHSVAAPRPKLPSHEYPEMGYRVHSLHAWRAPNLSRKSSPRRWHEGWRERSVRLVVPHGVSPWGGFDDPAGSDGSTDAGNDAPHGGSHAWILDIPEHPGDRDCSFNPYPEHVVRRRTHCDPVL